MNAQLQNERAKRKKKDLAPLALFGRVATLPAVLALAVLVTVFFMRPEVYIRPYELYLSILFLLVFPVLAYPIAKLVPSLRAQGREGARNTAFITSLVGYLAAVLYTHIALSSEELCFIAETYFFSAVLLFFCNKAVGIRASAHSCGAAGAAVLFGAVMGGVAWLISALVFLFARWSSLSLRRHDGKEFFYGALCVLGGFMLASVCTTGFSLIFA